MKLPTRQNPARERLAPEPHEVNIPSRLASPSWHTAIRAFIGAGATTAAVESPVGQAFVDIALFAVHGAGLPDELVGPAEVIVTALTVAVGAAALAWVGSMGRDAVPTKASSLASLRPRSIL